MAKKILSSNIFFVFGLALILLTGVLVVLQHQGAALKSGIVSFAFLATGGVVYFLESLK